MVFTMVFEPNRKKIKYSRGFCKVLEDINIYTTPFFGPQSAGIQKPCKTSRIFGFFTIWPKNHCKYHGNCNTIVKKSKILEVLQGFWIPADSGPEKGAKPLTEIQNQRKIKEKTNQCPRIILLFVLKSKNKVKKK